MFRATRVLWAINKQLSAVLFENGEKNTKLCGVIIGKEVLGDGELDFQQEVDVYRRRSVKDAAYMILIDTASAWKVAGNDYYADCCLQAAKRLLYIFYNEDEPEKKMIENYENRVAERIKARLRWERAVSDAMID